GTGASGGVLAARGNGNNDLVTIRPVTGAGQFWGAFSTISAATIGTGIFTVASSTGSPGLVKSRYRPGGGGGSFAINNNHTAIFISDTTEASADPLEGSVPLTLNVPEPGSLSLLG